MSERKTYIRSDCVSKSEVFAYILKTVEIFGED